jgi:DNA-binding beta-propeller fold protein YncE
MTESTEKSKKNMKRILLSAVMTAQIMLLVIAATAPSYAYALTIVNTWGSPGSGNGQFNGPSGMDLDFKGNLYVVDTGNNRVQKLNATDGKFTTAWGSSGSGQGQFNSPIEAAVDEGRGHIYVTDGSNARIQAFNVTNGKFITAWGSSGSGQGQFVAPTGIAVDPNIHSEYLDPSTAIRILDIISFLSFIY